MVFLKRIQVKSKYRLNKITLSVFRSYEKKWKEKGLQRLEQKIYTVISNTIN
jgi:hypothetical protein